MGTSNDKVDIGDDGRTRYIMEKGEENWIFCSGTGGCLSSLRVLVGCVPEIVNFRKISDFCCGESAAKHLIRTLPYR